MSFSDGDIHDAVTSASGERAGEPSTPAAPVAPATPAAASPPAAPTPTPGTRVGASPPATPVASPTPTPEDEDAQLQRSKGPIPTDRHIKAVENARRKAAEATRQEVIASYGVSPEQYQQVRGSIDLAQRDPVGF